MDTKEMLARMIATWPKFSQDELSLQLWSEDLDALDPEYAMRAFRDLRDRMEYAPTWAEFRAAYTSAIDRDPDAPDHLRTRKAGLEWVDRLPAFGTAGYDARRADQTMRGVGPVETRMTPAELDAWREKRAATET